MSAIFTANPFKCRVSFAQATTCSGFPSKNGRWQSRQVEQIPTHRARLLLIPYCTQKNNLYKLTTAGGAWMEIHTKRRYMKSPTRVSGQRVFPKGINGWSMFCLLSTWLRRDRRMEAGIGEGRCLRWAVVTRLWYRSETGPIIPHIHDPRSISFLAPRQPPRSPPRLVGPFDPEVGKIILSDSILFCSPPSEQVASDGLTVVFPFSFVFYFGSLGFSFEFWFFAIFSCLFREYSRFGYTTEGDRTEVMKIQWHRRSFPAFIENHP